MKTSQPTRRSRLSAGLCLGALLAAPLLIQPAAAQSPDQSPETNRYDVWAEHRGVVEARGSDGLVNGSAGVGGSNTGIAEGAVATNRHRGGLDNRYSVVSRSEGETSASQSSLTGEALTEGGFSGARASGSLVANNHRSGPASENFYSLSALTSGATDANANNFETVASGENSMSGALALGAGAANQHRGGGVNQYNVMAEHSGATSAEATSSAAGGTEASGAGSFAGAMAIGASAANSHRDGGSNTYHLGASNTGSVQASVGDPDRLSTSGAIDASGEGAFAGAMAVGAEAVNSHRGGDANNYSVLSQNSGPVNANVYTSSRREASGENAQTGAMAIGASAVNTHRSGPGSSNGYSVIAENSGDVSTTISSVDGGRATGAGSFDGGVAIGVSVANTHQGGGSNSYQIGGVHTGTVTAISSGIGTPGGGAAGAIATGVRVSNVHSR